MQLIWHLEEEYLLVYMLIVEKKAESQLSLELKKLEKNKSKKSRSEYD